MMSVTKDFHMTTFAEPVKQSDTISANYWVNSNLQNYITTQINEYLLHLYLPCIMRLNFLTLSTNVTGHFKKLTTF